jgi:hypothetical protein
MVAHQLVAGVLTDRDKNPRHADLLSLAGDTSSLPRRRQRSGIAPPSKRLAEGVLTADPDPRGWQS